MQIPWFTTVGRFLLPLLATALWLVGGVISIALLQAFPYELLSLWRRGIAIPSVAAAFILLYNAPMLTGEWKADGIVFLGIAYPIVYRYAHNSIGPIFNYSSYTNYQ